MPDVVRAVLLGLGLLNFGPSIRADAEQRALKALGDRSYRDAWRGDEPGRPVVRLNLRFRRVTDADMKHVAVFKRLQTLDLLRTKVTDVGLKELAGLTELEELHLGSTKVTDAGLKELVGLDKLR